MAKTTVAVVVIKTSKVFERLGHLPLMSWCLKHLDEVRGIERVFYCATSRLMEPAKQLLSKIPGASVLPLPARCKTDPEIHSWVVSDTGPARRANVVLVINPVNPFLPASKMEACIEHARDTKHGDAISRLGQRAHCVFKSGRYETLDGSILMPTVVAFTVPGKAAGRTPLDVEIVDVGTIEALDATERDGHRIATALVNSGQV